MSTERSKWRHNRTLRLAAQGIWFGLIVYFLIWYLVRNWPAFSRHAWRFNLWWLAAAIFWAIVRRFCGGLRWLFMVHQNAAQLPWRDAWPDMRIYFLSNLASYIPGSIWYMANRLHQSRQRGHSAVKTTIALFFETGLLVWAGVMVGLPVLSRFGTIGPQAIIGLGALMVIISLAATHPSAVGTIVGFIMKVLRRPAPTINVRWSWGLKIWILSLAIYPAWGLSLFCLLKGLHADISWWRLPYITGALALAWVIGFLAPWAPAGLGVREGMLYWLLAPYIATPVAMAAVVATRLVTLIEDLFWAGISLIFSGKSLPPESAPPSESPKPQSEKASS